MCGRFAFYSPAEATAALFGATGSLDLSPRYNIAPTQDIAAVRNREGDDERELVALRWGLVPFWAKDPAIGNRMINARAETVASKPAYRAAYRQRRCLLPASGFYEWKGLSSGKGQSARQRQPQAASRPVTGPGSRPARAPQPGPRRPAGAGLRARGPQRR